MSAESNHSDNTPPTSGGPSYLWVGLKFFLAVALVSAGLVARQGNDPHSGNEAKFSSENPLDASWWTPPHSSRRLSEESLTGGWPSYVQPLMEELSERQKLFAEAEVIKYWFEYTGPLQVSFFCFVLVWRLVCGKDETFEIQKCIVHLKSKVTLCLMNLITIVRNPIGSHHHAACACVCCILFDLST